MDERFAFCLRDRRRWPVQVIFIDMVNRAPAADDNPLGEIQEGARRPPLKLSTE